MAKKKKNATLPKVPQWKHVTSWSGVKWSTISLTELKDWIARSVPPNTPDNEILLEFEATEEWGYYDDVSVDININLSVLEK